MTVSQKNKVSYKAFCSVHPEMPIFLQDWWLDLVCKDGSWEVIMANDKEGEIIAVLPYYITKTWGIKMIRMPDLTPHLGAWIPQGIRYGKSNFNILTELIEQIPSLSWVAQRHPIQLTNWLPFYWQGFKQTSLYTYQLDTNLSSLQLFSNIKSDARNKIRKAEAILQIKETEDIELFYQTNKKSFARQSKKVPYSLGFLKTLNQVLCQRKQRMMYLAVDDQENIHACIYLIWDGQCIYNFLLGADTNFRNSGAVQLLLWTGIKLAKEQKKIFDFEGSMMENVEPVFRAFGGKLIPYFKIYKGIKLFMILNSLR